VTFEIKKANKLKNKINGGLFYYKSIIIFLPVLIEYFIATSQSVRICCNANGSS